MGRQSNYNRFPQGVNIAGLNVLNSYSGNIFWVDSGHPSAADGNKGTFRQPLATIDAAIGLCTAINGDIIMVAAGHSETITASITADIAGVSIVGCGNGTNRPTLVGPNADATIDVTAANVAIKNLIFSADAGTTQGATQKIYVNASYCTIEGCQFNMGQYDDDAIYVSTSGDHCSVLNNEFLVSANGPDTFVYLEGNAGALTHFHAEGNFCDGGTTANSPDLGMIYSSGVHTACRVLDNLFFYMSAGGGIEFTAAATGLIQGNFFGGGVLGQMLDPGSCYCSNNKESDAIDKYGREFPATAAS